MTQPYKICTNCGQHLAPYMQQCGQCKAIQHSVAAPPPYPARVLPKHPSHSFKKPLIVFVVACFLFLMIGFFSSLTAHKQETGLETLPEKTGILHAKDAATIPGLSTTRQPPDNTFVVMPIEDGTRMTWYGGTFEIEGNTYTRVHLTSGSMAGQDSIVPAICAEDR